MTEAAQTKATPLYWLIHGLIWTQRGELDTPNVASDSLLSDRILRVFFPPSYCWKPLLHSSGAVQDTLFKFVKERKADSAPFSLSGPHWTRSPSKTTVPRHVTSSLVTCNSCSTLCCYYVLQNSICTCTNVQSVWSTLTLFRFITYAYLFIPIMNLHWQMILKREPVDRQWVIESKTNPFSISSKMALTYWDYHSPASLPSIFRPLLAPLALPPGSSRGGCGCGAGQSRGQLR